MDSSLQLDLAPTYQRRSVWNDEYRRFYIDTILRNYPSPAIYLEIETRPGSPTVHHVIDGKQRLETIISFTKDEFHLGQYFAEEGFESAYYSDLSDLLRDSFVDYVLSVENITRSTNAEIKSAFERLNKNTAKLNRQELRKAQYEGAFITKMTNLAEHPFWTNVGVASRARIARMLDVEYVSEIYLLTMHGILDGSPNLLDDYYSSYDEEISNEDETDLRYYTALEWLNKLDIQGTRWTNLGDFYSLWSAVLELDRGRNTPSPESAQVVLRKLHEAFSDPSSADELKYSDAVRQGTNKESSRLIRRELIVSALKEA
ncbi:hypothetical protein IWX75_001466 [Arthrobacter sp. CAN_A6]|uniref:DUF262 domain-containing protein n=1 Tax=Arthrobacter sp. CAN_A6 TaxID=2787721 RepID=UPI0018CB1846